MRQSSDKGFSPNTRYDRAPMKKGTVMSNANIIRAFANYNKDRKVVRSTIIIEAPTADMSYIIYDPVWQSKLNGEWVRVRRFGGETNKIYLFDLKTDTYLTMVEAHLDVVGDQASATNKDMGRISTHLAKNKKAKKYRKEKLDEINAVDNRDVFVELPNVLQGNLFSNDQLMSEISEAGLGEKDAKIVLQETEQFHEKSAKEFVEIDGINELAVEQNESDLELVEN